MPNTAEYKDWLFVKVPEDAIRFGLPEQDFGVVLQYYSIYWQSETLPPGSYQIIGKGDAIDWEGIVASFELAGSKGWQDYSFKNDYRFPFLTPTESGHSLLKSFGMEPGTTLVLKKK